MNPYPRISRSIAAIVLVGGTVAASGAAASVHPLLWRPDPEQIHARDHSLGVPGGEPRRTIYFTPSRWVFSFFVSHDPGP